MLSKSASRISLCCLFIVPWLVGCFGGPGRVEAPKWGDVEAIADACMDQADENNDGFITLKEAKANAPGLAYAEKTLDEDLRGAAKNAGVKLI